MTGLGAAEPSRRMLVINPNTNGHVTGLIRDLARGLTEPEIAIEVVNPTAGPIAIEGPSDRNAAEPEVVRIIDAAHRSGTRGFVLACFDDIGVAEARRLGAGPVFDACQAGILAAHSLTDRFAIVTTVSNAVGRIERHVVRYGATGACVVRAAGIGVADAASGEGDDRLHATIAQAIAEDGAKVIVLGSGGLTGRAAELSARFGVPFIDGVAAAIRLCQAVLHLGDGQTLHRHGARRGASR